MKKIILTLFVALLPILVLSGCVQYYNGVPVNSAGYTRTFTFTKDEEGFEGGFADLPIDYNPFIYTLAFKQASVPIKDKLDKGLMLKGHNRSDDLFMYVSRKFNVKDGLRPNTKYTVLLSFDIATNTAGGGIGIGGSPGASVYVKAGIINKAPLVENINGMKTINVDKGIQANGGKEMQVLGNIEKINSTDDTYEYKNFQNKIDVTTNAKGEAWLIIGTDSGFEGLTDIYITNIKLTANLFTK